MSREFKVGDIVSARKPTITDGSGETKVCWHPEMDRICQNMKIVCVNTRSVVYANGWYWYCPWLTLIRAVDAANNPQPTQEPTTPPESDPLTKAIAESQDRTKGLQDLQAKLAKAATMQGDLATLRLEIAILREKHPIDGGEPELRSGCVQIVNHEGPAMPDAVTYGFSFEGQPKKPSKTKPKPKAKKAGKKTRK